MWLAYSFTTHKLLFFDAHFIVIECLVHFSNLHVGVLLAGLHPAAEQPGGWGALGWCIGDGVLDGIYDIISP